MSLFGFLPSLYCQKFCAGQQPARAGVGISIVLYDAQFILVVYYYAVVINTPHDHVKPLEKEKITSLRETPNET